MPQGIEESMDQKEIFSVHKLSLMQPNAEFLAYSSEATQFYKQFTEGGGPLV